MIRWAHTKQLHRQACTENCSPHSLQVADSVKDSPVVGSRHAATASTVCMPLIPHPTALSSFRCCGLAARWSAEVSLTVQACCIMAYPFRYIWFWILVPTHDFSKPICYSSSYIAYVVLAYRRVGCQTLWPRSATTWPPMAESARALHMTASSRLLGSRATPHTPHLILPSCA